MADGDQGVGTNKSTSIEAMSTYHAERDENFMVRGYWYLLMLDMIFFR